MGTRCHRGIGHWRHRSVSASAAALVSLTGGCLVSLAIAPTPVHAYTSRLNIDLAVQPGESYETLVRRAEAVARAAAQRSFDRDILITDVVIVITAEYESRIAPVLSVEATRKQWGSLPDSRRWATYYNNSKVLLGMDRVPTTATTTPGPTVTTPAAAPGTAINAPGGPTVIPGTGIPGTPNPAIPNQVPNQAPTTNQAPSGGVVAPGGTPGTTPDITRPGSPQILPDRILTPGGIGK